MTRLLTLLLTVLFFFAPAAYGSDGEGCEVCLTPERQQAYDGFQQRLAGAATLEEAQALANKRLGAADSALSKAQRVVPGDAGLAEGRADLDALQGAVHSAQTPGQVAAAFAPADAQGSGRCDFSTGEIVAIVLGFILGIIPGIILLILLC